MTVFEVTLFAELIESSYGETGSSSLLFSYRSDMPLSVFTRSRGVVHEYGRDLLREGLERTKAGGGDVQFLNHGLNVLMHLETLTSYATYVLDRGDLRAFLRATQRLVEFDAEVVDFDAELDALLKDGAR